MAEGAHPYPPAQQPVEFDWAWLGIGYGTWCDRVGVRGYIAGFRNVIGEACISKIVKRIDGVAAKMADGEAALVLDADLAPGEGDRGAESRDTGEMPPF